jgi:hypothetical protein
MEKTKEIESVITGLLDWANKQPEYTTFMFPDEPRRMNSVERFQLAKLAETAKYFLGVENPAFRTFSSTIGENSVSGALITMPPLLDVLCDVRRTILPQQNEPKPNAGGNSATQIGFRFIGDGDKVSQVFYDENPLPIPPGKLTAILKRLADSAPIVVKFSELESTTINRADEQIRTYISQLKKILKKHTCYTITTHRGYGYSLMQTHV